MNKLEKASNRFFFTNEEVEFITSHTEHEADRLLLSASRFPNINVPLCVNTIIARKRLGKKVPEWSNNPKLIFPTLLSLEQCSSSKSASYKAGIIQRCLEEEGKKKGEKEGEEGREILGADLTGGLGIDSFFLSPLCKRFYYYEREDSLCRAAENNFRLLGRENIEIICQETNNDTIKTLPDNLTFIFIDPARREKSGSGKKVVSIEEYQPNMIEIQRELLNRCKLALVKISPMADIKQTVALLPQTKEIHIVSINNECKELLFLLKGGEDNERLPQEEIPIIAVEIAEDKEAELRFTYHDEQQCDIKYADNIEGYLFQPGKEIMKAGAFKSIAKKYDLEKLAPATHLYIKKELAAEGPDCNDFQGKIFEIKEVIPFNKEGIKRIKREYPAADFSARNFPLKTEEVIKRIGIKKIAEDSHENPPHIFAVTTFSKEKVMIVTSPLLH